MKARLPNIPIMPLSDVRYRVKSLNRRSLWSDGWGAIAMREPMEKIQITCVDPEAIHYGTFQSHNQKVLSNRRGIFMTHIRTRDQPYRAQTWRLSQSTNGGRTFSTIHEATHATNPPVIVTDEADNIHLVRVDFLDWHARHYSFLAEKGYREPSVTEIPYATGDKYAMVFDARRRCLYYFPRHRSFHVLGLDGTIQSSDYNLFKTGPNANVQYPQLDLEPDGTLHAVWTSEYNHKYLYWDIHHILSRDGGKTWRNLDGTRLAPPILADDTGPALRITPDDEFDVHTWLANFLVKDGKLHFVYRAATEPPRMHYMRYDIATARRDAHHSPELRGATIRLTGFDGFFATRIDQPGSPLYCVMNAEGYIGCLVSHDNGATWRDHARSEEKFESYSVGGCHGITADGFIIGSFTDMTGLEKTSFSPGRVMFLRIKA